MYRTYNNNKLAFITFSIGYKALGYVQHKLPIAMSQPKCFITVKLFLGLRCDQATCKWVVFKNRPRGEICKNTLHSQLNFKPPFLSFNPPHLLVVPLSHILNQRLCVYCQSMYILFYPFIVYFVVSLICKIKWRSLFFLFLIQLNEPLIEINMGGEG